MARNRVVLSIGSIHEIDRIVFPFDAVANAKALFDVTDDVLGAKVGVRTEIGLKFPLLRITYPAG